MIEHRANEEKHWFVHYDWYLLELPVQQKPDKRVLLFDAGMMHQAIAWVLNATDASWCKFNMLKNKYPTYFEWSQTNSILIFRCSL